MHFSVQHFISLMYCNIFHMIAFKFAIGCIVSEFFSNLHPETISMKILTLHVIKSSCHRKHFVQGCIHSLLVQKAHNRSYIARSGS